MPATGLHSLEFQLSWLAKERGGNIPHEVVESFSKLLDLAIKNNVLFEDLCVYALEAANEEKEKQQAASNQLSAIELAASDRLPVRNQSIILATAEKLKKYLDDDFDLLLISIKKRNQIPYWVVFLGRSSMTLEISSAISNNNVYLEDLERLGYIECIYNHHSFKYENILSYVKKYGIDMIATDIQSTKQV